MPLNVNELAKLFPGNFVLGVAAAAAQIEGAVHDGGRGASGWDAFSDEPGRVLNGDTPRIACDHYNRYSEDIELMRQLGIDSYRLSIAWPRIMPRGDGVINQAGLDFYDGLIDSLLAAGIDPMATLYHWDTPLPLEQRGGWLNRDTAEAFGKYAQVCGDRFGDRVGSWVTINEPATVTLEGYALGIHAPGKALLFDALPSAHFQLLAHGLATQALRAAQVKGPIGITNAHTVVVPDSEAPEDQLFADAFDLVHNRIFADPVLLGKYPEVTAELAEMFGSLDSVPDSDLAIIHQPLDFYGLNYYMPTKIAAGAGEGISPDGEAAAMAEVPFRIEPWPELPMTGFGWPVGPEYLGEVLVQLQERYGKNLPPVTITENGASFPDEVLTTDDGVRSVSDEQRIGYLSDHLEAALLATSDGGQASGVELTGYYVWSILDNFEWAAGYSQRFGLVHVDFETLARTPKQSYFWYQSLLAARSANRL